MSKAAIFWFTFSVLIGAVLFHTSQRVTDGRQRLAVMQSDLRTEEETLRVLQAEWSYLNQPDRLEKLSQQYLQLTPMKGKQFTTADALPVRAAPEDQGEEGIPVAGNAPPQMTATPVSAVPRAPVRKPAPAARPATAQVRTAVPVTPEKPRTAAPQQKTAASTAPAAPHAPRGFGDVMQSLGMTP